jgi:hypothetical protein
VPLRVEFLPRATESPVGQNEVGLEVAGVVYLTRTFELRLIGEVGVTRVWSNAAADEIIVFGAGLDAVFGLAAGLLVVFDFLLRLGGAFFGVVVALPVTLLRKHEINPCIVPTSSSFVFVSGVRRRRSRGFSASVSQMAVNFHLSVQGQSMSETQCQRLSV